MDLDRKAEKLPYEEPQLVTLGSLEEITQESVFGEDSFWSKPRHWPPPPDCYS